MTPDSKLRRTLHLSALLAFALVAFGCGERSYMLDPGHIDAVPASELLQCLEGAPVELTRFSTTCSKSSDKRLSAVVGDGAEFPSEMVASVESPCADGPNPGIEVLIEHSAVIFDFSQVSGRGRFPSAEFDGYVIDVAVTSEHALLIGALINRRNTTIAVDREDIVFESDHIEVNLEGVAYEPGSMLEIDLLFANTPALPEDA